jgi:hypothetical protein
MIRLVRNWGALGIALSTLVISVPIAGGEAITDMGVWGVQSIAAVNDFFGAGCNGSPSPCTQFTSTAATSNNWIGWALRLDQVSDGETTEWHFINPDGSSIVAWSRYHASGCSGCTPGCCWEHSDGSSQCGVICNDPTFAENIWVTNQYWCKTPTSGYRIEIWNNGAPVLSHPFSLQHDPAGNLGITSPEDDRINYSPFHLVQMSQSNFTSAIAPFSAGTNLSGSITWSVTTHYATSGWAGADPPANQFTTTNGEERDQTYQDLGGQLRVQAQMAAFGTTITDCVTTYVEGPESGIDDAIITAQLKGVYQDNQLSPNHGPTANLLTGIASKEASYAQFQRYPLFNQEDLFHTSAFGLNPKFPTESPAGKFPIGAFIGLMQVPTTNPHAWNWDTNTRDGAREFDKKMVIAKGLWADSIKGVASKMVKGHSGMVALSGSQNEDNALMLYGGFVVDYGNSNEQKALDELYWVPDCPGGTITQQGNKLSCSGPNGWQPKVNPSQLGVTVQGIQYVADVRAKGK